MEEGNSETQQAQEVQTHEEVATHEQEHETEAQSSHEDVEQAQEEKNVPITALQKERKKRQQAQKELEMLKSQSTQTQEEDYSRYESVTREELGKEKFEIVRQVREEDWSEKFPDRAAYLEENLQDFLNERPNLAYAINGSNNRLKEAWDLMEGLKPKKVTKTEVRKDVPKAPGTVPKSAALNEAVDVMTMSDKEFREWRKSQRKRR